MESRNAKFLENDLVSRSSQFHNTLSKKYHHQSQAPGLSHKFTVRTHEVESGITQPIIEAPQTYEPMDLIVEEHQNVEQSIE